MSMLSKIKRIRSRYESSGFGSSSDVGEAQAQDEVQLPLSEAPTSKKRRLQPLRATKVLAGSLIRQAAETRANYASGLMEVDGEINSAVQQSERLPLYSSDDSADEYMPGKIAHGIWRERRPMRANLKRDKFTDRDSVITGIGEAGDRKSVSARHVRPSNIHRESSAEEAGNLSIQVPSAGVIDLASDIPEPVKTDTVPMEVDRQSVFAGHTSNDSSESSFAPSVEVKPRNPTKALLHKAASVKVESPGLGPTTLTRRPDVVTLPKQPLPTIDDSLNAIRAQPNTTVVTSVVGDAPLELTAQSISAVANQGTPTPEVLSVSETMAKARASRTPLPKQPPPQVYYSAFPQVALIGTPGEDVVAGARMPRPRQGVSEYRAHSAEPKVPGISDIRRHNILGRPISVQPQVKGPVSHHQASVPRTPNMPPTREQPSMTGLSWAAMTPQPMTRIPYLRFKNMTTSSEADLAEFIQTIKAYLPCTNTDFLDSVKRYLTKKEILRKLEQRSDYRDLILGQATASSAAIILHHALVHTLRILDDERDTARYLAGRVHDLDDEFSSRHARHMKANTIAVTNEQVDATHRFSDVQAKRVGAVETLQSKEKIPAVAASPAYAGMMKPVAAYSSPYTVVEMSSDQPSSRTITSAQQCRTIPSDQTGSQGLMARDQMTELTLGPEAAATISHQAPDPVQKDVGARNPPAPPTISENEKTYTAKMKTRIYQMEKGKVYPRCDRCKRSDKDCMVYKRGLIRCFGCNMTHDYCNWNSLTDKEIRWINDATSNDAWPKQVEDGSGPEALATAFQDATSSQAQRHQQDQDSQRNTADLDPEPKKKIIDVATHAIPAPRPKIMDSSGAYAAEMRARIRSLNQFEKIPLPCDNCRKRRWDCSADGTACYGCHRSHEPCTWNNLSSIEIQWLKDTAASARGDVGSLKDVIVID